MRHLAFSLGVVVVLSGATWAQNRASQSTDANGPRVTALVLQPSRIDTNKKYSLLPSPTELKTGNAADFYNKAVEAMPKNINASQLQEWRKAPLDKLPQNEVAAFLQQAKASLDLVTQGTTCKDCNWPAFQPGTSPAHLSEYGDLSRLLCIKARLATAQKRYDDAVDAVRTQMAMARQIGDAPTIIQALVGIAMGNMALSNVVDLAQVPNSPNLCTALGALPRPLIDIEKPIAREVKAAETNQQYSKAVRDAMRKQVEPAYEQVRRTTQRLNADIAARQCIEAVRHYAATHNNQLPAKLADISDAQLPNDPATGKPFSYHLEGAKAVLETSAPKGGTPKDGVRYEMTMAQ